MAYTWNREEDEALQGLPHATQVMYLRGIRKHVDYATGIVGVKRRISFASLEESLYVEPVQRRGETAAPTKKQIRVMLDQLKRAGLIERMGADKPLIFRLPLLSQDNSVQNLMGTSRARFGARNGAPTPSSESNELDQLKGTVKGTQKINNRAHIFSHTDTTYLGDESPDSGAQKSEPTIWDVWRSLPGADSGALLGRMIKAHGEQRVAEAVAIVATKKPADPVAFLRGVLADKKPRRFSA